MTELKSTLKTQKNRVRNAQQEIIKRKMTKKKSINVNIIDVKIKTIKS